MPESPGDAQRLRVFLSYAAEEGELAEQVHLRLTTAGHEVFFDRTTLAPGDGFDAAIRVALQTSDLMVFLVSPNSVEDGAYTRTELRMARDQWPNPARRILPVMAAPTDFAKVPAYLTAVTILKPEGNLPAEVCAAVDELASGASTRETVLGQVDELAEYVREQKAAKAHEIHRKTRLIRDAELDRSAVSGNLLSIAVPCCLALFVFVAFGGFRDGGPSKNDLWIIAITAAAVVLVPILLVIVVRALKSRAAKKRATVRLDFSRDGDTQALGSNNNDRDE